MSSGEMARAPPPPRTGAGRAAAASYNFLAAAAAARGRPGVSPRTDRVSLHARRGHGQGPGRGPRAALSQIAGERRSDESPVRAGHRVRIVEARRRRRLTGCEGVVIPKRDGEADWRQVGQREAAVAEAGESGGTAARRSNFTSRPAHWSFHRSAETEARGSDQRITGSVPCGAQKSGGALTLNEKRLLRRARPCTGRKPGARNKNTMLSSSVSLSRNVSMTRKPKKPWRRAKRCVRSSLRKNRAKKAKASAATAESTAVKATRAAEEADHCEAGRGQGARLCGNQPAGCTRQSLSARRRHEIRHRHAVEQASVDGVEDGCDDSARTRRLERKEELRAERKEEARRAEKAQNEAARRLAEEETGEGYSRESCRNEKGR